MDDSLKWCADFETGFIEDRMERRVLMRRLLFLLLIACSSVVGCSDNVDIGLVVEQLQAQTEQSTVQTTLPPEVLEAMKFQADKMDKQLKNILTIADRHIENPEIVEHWKQKKQQVLKKGLPDIDFHALQKAFYTKYIDAGGIAIVSPDKVKDVFLLAARDAILVMTSKFPELRERLLAKHGRFYMILVKDPKDLRDIPEMQLNNSVINDTEYRYSGACSKNTGFEVEGEIADYVRGYCFAHVHERSACPPLNIFIHEFAHALEWEMEYLKPGIRDRIKEAYDQMIAEFGEEAKSKYHMAVAPHEYFAVGVEWWFRNLSWSEKLIEEHPMLAELLAEWFPRVECSMDWDLIITESGITEAVYDSISWKLVDDE